VALSLCPAAQRVLVAGVLKGDVPSGHIPDALCERAARLLAEATSKQIDAIGWDDPRYPDLLRTIDAPPPVLFTKGAGRLTAPSVAIVGSRAATAYALQVAERLGADLATAGLCIVSGLARGVDSAAHRGALAVGGATVAVLGSGVDVIYPSEHVQLAGEIQESGLVVSEFPAGTEPRPAHFPRRNRIISGLALGVVVVEAAERSGSLITAGCALQQGREVMAVPGNVLTGRHRGAHALLKDGAAVVENAQDVLAALGITSPSLLASLSPPASRPSTSSGRPEQVEGRHSPLTSLLLLMPSGEECDLDLLAARGALSAVELLPKLLELELAGFVRRTAGGRFVRAT